MISVFFKFIPTTMNFKKINKLANARIYSTRDKKKARHMDGLPLLSTSVYIRVNNW